MTDPRTGDPKVPAETQAVAQRILQDADCEACLAAEPKGER